MGWHAWSIPTFYLRPVPRCHSWLWSSGHSSKISDNTQKKSWEEEGALEQAAQKDREELVKNEAQWRRLETGRQQGLGDKQAGWGQSGIHVILPLCIRIDLSVWPRKIPLLDGNNNKEKIKVRCEPNTSRKWEGGLKLSLRLQLRLPCMSFSIERTLLNQLGAKQKLRNCMSLGILLEYAIRDVTVHPCPIAFMLLHQPKGAAWMKSSSNNKRRAILWSEKESLCSLQLCHLKGTTPRRDLALKFNLKNSYLGRNSQRQRKKQEGYKHYDQVFPEGQDRLPEASHGAGPSPALRGLKSAAGDYINTREY